MSKTALSAARKILTCIRSYNTDASINCILPPAEVLAHIIDGQYGPVVEALQLFIDRMASYGDWRDGCFYYNDRSASELQKSIERGRAALEAKP